jgi:hypothetical protein
MRRTLQERVKWETKKQKENKEEVEAFQIGVERRDNELRGQKEIQVCDSKYLSVKKRRKKLLFAAEPSQSNIGPGQHHIPTVVTK